MGDILGAESALKNAMSMMKTGIKSSDVGRTIEKTIKELGLIPIANLFFYLHRHE